MTRPAHIYLAIDGPAYVASVTYNAPRVVPGCTPAVVVSLAECPAHPEEDRPASSTNPGPGVAG